MTRKDILVENKHFAELNPITCGYHETEPRHNPGLTLPPFYLIHYVKNGYGIFETDGKRYRVGPHKIFIIKKNHVARYESDDTEPWEYIWIGFDGKLAERLDSLESPVLDYDGVGFDEIAEADKMNEMRTEFLTARLFDIVSRLFDTTSPKINRVKKVKDYIKSNYMNTLSVDGTAEILNLNRRYLSRIFRAETGLSIKAYIIKTKMDKAEEFLKRGFTVGEVAQMVGYEDVFNFSKMFKKTKGVSPKSLKPKNSV